MLSHYLVLNIRHRGRQVGFPKRTHAITSTRYTSNGPQKPNLQEIPVVLVNTGIQHTKHTHTSHIIYYDKDILFSVAHIGLEALCPSTMQWKGNIHQTQLLTYLTLFFLTQNRQIVFSPLKYLRIRRETNFTFKKRRRQREAETHRER